MPTKETMETEVIEFDDILNEEDSQPSIIPLMVVLGVGAVIGGVVTEKLGRPIVSKVKVGWRKLRHKEAIVDVDGFVEVEDGE